MMQDLKKTKIENFEIEELKLQFKNIALARVLEKKTRLELGTILEVSYQQYTKYETQKNHINLPLTMKLAKYLEYDLFCLLFEDIQSKAKTENYKSKFSKEQKNFFMEAVRSFENKEYLGLAEFFQQLRKQGGKITYEAIAKEIGASTQDCHRYFQGKNPISLTNIVKLVNYFYFKKSLDS